MSFWFFDGLQGTGSPESRSFPGASPAVLCLHGFCSTPEEVLPCARVAHELGLRAEAPLSPGHGERARALSQTRYSDWFAAARTHAQRLKSEGRLILCGLSLGSLLALETYLEAPEQVDGLVLLANALWLTAPFPSWALSLASRLRLPEFGFPKFSSDIADPVARKHHLTYAVQPTHAAIEVLKAGARLSQRLSEVRCPTLIVHGAHDHVCPVSNAWRAAAALGTEDVRVVVLPRSRHIISYDHDRAQLARELRCFFGRFVASSVKAELAGAGLTDAGLTGAGLADAGLADAGLADAGPFEAGRS